MIPRYLRVMRQMLLAVGSVLVGCGGEPPLDCADVRHSPIEVDLAGPAPVFSWEGDAPHGFAVIDAFSAPRWELICRCPPDGCTEPEHFEARACVPSPLTYGEVPEGAPIDQGPGLQVEALPLDRGRSYTALIWSDCVTDDLPKKVLESADFVAP